MGCDLDPALLWLWCRPAAAAPIQPLLGTSICHKGAGLKRQKKKKKKRKKNEIQTRGKYSMVTEVRTVVGDSQEGQTLQSLAGEGP